MALKTTDGTIKRPQKVVIYGPEGIGKTTLAAHFPTPVFIDTEGGTSHINVDRAEWGDSWKSLLETVKEVPGSGFKTLIIDTADWAEQLCIQHICKTKGVAGIEDIGYGKGYTYVGEEFAKLLSALNDVIKSGINVVITAHAKMRKFEQPDELGAYDRWEMKLSKQVAPLVKEWADMVLFCNYQTVVITTKEQKKKAQGGKRVMYTSHHPCWDAKNRHCLPEKLDMDYEQIKGVIEGYPEPAARKPDPKPAPVKRVELPEEHKPTPMEHLLGLMLMNGLDEKDIEAACVKAKQQPKGKPLDQYDDDFIQGMILDKWDKFYGFVLKNIKNVPKEWVDESNKKGEK